jgi:hypothetical protein
MARLLLVAVIAGCTGSASSEPVPKPAVPARVEPARPARPAAKEGRPVTGKPAFSDAEYAAHIERLKERLREKKLGNLRIEIEDPFVVVGDGTAEELARGRGTVRWAADKLEQDFFEKRPGKILDVFLFQGAASYERGVRALTGRVPSTPYGFYSSAQDGLFMNIATGGGTLVHEIVHPYVEADFPAAPAWLNEGLGSLFEQSAEKGGHIVGRTNWRLAGLQRAIERGGLPSFQKLTGLDTGEFYGDESGTNYAQSRYLMYYLQEQGLLRDFYRAFRAASAKDPTGYATLVQALGERDMGAFQKRWERYVAGLRFP